ncbi:hypothetical protein [Novosphingobium sp. BW1]|uniref:hypothetical protein n=1 Tax=Novosphingobium sp. BW1 TaxID=2592621 RepID=UPI0011DE714D|nr:hypothetical protein [Novosphingobium sp. BW1]TYC85059.1 hypothetical protein FMM79_18365 [Novosphingobium sp. BW1]
MPSSSARHLQQPHAITLTNAPQGKQSANATFEAGYLPPSTGNATGGTTIRPQINRATFEAWADPVSGAAPLTLHQTLYVTPEGESPRVLCFGNFTIRKGLRHHEHRLHSRRRATGGCRPDG